MRFIQHEKSFKTYVCQQSVFIGYHGRFFFQKLKIVNLYTM
jgi:hypothetical protein